MSQPHSRPAEPSHRAGPTIFVVDDEPMLLELAAAILEPQGYDLKTFRDPAAAVEAFRTAQPRPALVITDYAMHNLTGMDLIAACRKLEPAQRILLVSGTVGPEIFFKATAKPDRFLAKPYQAQQLTNLVKEMLPG